jgi:hypothetical protein
MRRFDERLSPAPNCHCKDDHIARTTLHGACHDYARFARRYGTCAARASNNQVRIRFSHMEIKVIWSARLKPREANPVDEERVKLHQTMFAYAGS